MLRLFEMDEYLSAHDTVLVVEDDHSQLQMLSILSDYEHSTAALAANGQEALDWVADRRPALVILDWNLPRASGFLVAAAIRARYGTQVPILVVSAGATSFLAKPYHMADLLGAIQRLPAA